MQLGDSKARNDLGALQIVHHGTRDHRFCTSEFAPMKHFGTRAAARERLFDWPEARLISALLDIRSPLYLPDINGVHDPEAFARLIFSSGEAKARLPEDFLERVALSEQEAGEGQEEIVSCLKSAGYDGIGYRNHHEDPGSMSWVILDPSQAHILRDGRAGDSLDPWEYDSGSFTGPATISDSFTLNGRDEGFSHIWEALHEAGDSLPDLSRNEEGWSARWLNDWSPMASFGVFDPEGVPRGFYLEGLLWVDEEARGFGRSALMIEAAADLLGGRPTGEHSGLGMSPEGHAAHLSCLRKIRQKAIENGYVDFDHEDVQIPDLICP